MVCVEEEACVALGDYDRHYFEVERGELAFTALAVEVFEQITFDFAKSFVNVEGVSPRR